MGKVAGEVAKRLDQKSDAAITTIGTGNGEGMRAFQLVERHQGKLPGPMPPPGLAQVQSHLGDIRFRGIDG